MLNLICQKKLFREVCCARLIAFAEVICFASPVFAASFTATLDRDTVNVGESVTLSLNFEGGAPKTTPTLPAIPNLRVSNPSQSSQVSIINGAVSSTVSYTFQLTPIQPGDYTIPALKVEGGGQTLTSQPLKLKATRDNTPPINDAAAENRLAFMRIVLPKKEMFVGEVVTMELQLFLSSIVQNVSDLQEPQIPAAGLNVGKALIPKEAQRDVRIGNTVFRLVPITVPLTAVKNGKVAVGPVDFSMTLQLPSNSRGRTPIEQFFGSQAELRRVTVSTTNEMLTVLDLPKQNVPASFNGAIGNYLLNVSATPTNVTVGDPITVKIQIAGRGPLESLALPEQSAWRDFKTYPPTSKLETTDQFGLQGTKTFEQVVVPQTPDISALPPISFSFFNPDERRYHTLTNAPVPLVVKPSGTIVLPSFAASQSENAPPAQDIVHIKQRLGSTTRLGAPIITRGWFLATQTIPVLAFLGLVAWRRQTDNLANNPRLRRQRHVAQTVSQGLQDLKYFAAENFAEDFFATTFRLLQEQLGERLDVPASSITEAVIEEQLRPRAVSEQLLASLRELFQACNQARYAPGHAHGKFESLISKLETTLAELQKLKLK